MAEKRMISKVISISKKFNIRLNDHFTRLLYILLIPHSDDFGRLTGDPFKIKALILPMMSEVDWEEVEKSLDKLHQAELINWYESADERFIQIINFDDHQQGLHKRTRSKFPDPPNYSRKFPEIPSELNRTEENRTEEKGRELNGSEGKEITTVGAEFKIVLDSFCLIHGKAEHQVYSQITDIQRLIDKGIPSSTIISVMKEKHAEKVKKNESVHSFNYYNQAIIDAWEGGKKLEEYGGSLKGIRHGANQAQSSRSEGESKIYPGKWDNTVIPMPGMSG